MEPELLEKYFRFEDGAYAFRKELRSSIVFGRHNLLTDAPISRLDLLLCRNTIMYFNSESQARALKLFHFALENTGYLFLGKAEMLLTRAKLFEPAELKHRVFRKRPGLGRQGLPPEWERNLTQFDLGSLNSISRAVLDSTATGYIVISPGGNLILANATAGKLFDVLASDAGRPFQDLEISYRPIDLRGPVDEAVATQRIQRIRDVKIADGEGNIDFYDISVIPQYVEPGVVAATAVSFEHVTSRHYKELELEKTRHELETAYEELQSTNEELETTNEELQSTNEELETTNEELQTTSDELRVTSSELGTSNIFLESILSGLDIGVVALDLDLRVISWNRGSEELWGLRSDEVLGRYFLNLDIGLPTIELMPCIASTLSEDDPGDRCERALDAINRRGRPFCCKVSISTLVGLTG